MVPPAFRFQRFKVYQKAMDASGLIHDLGKELPDSAQDLRDMFHRHTLTMTLEIVRGTGEMVRRKAVEHFRKSARAAEFCQSVLERLRAQGCQARQLDEAHRLVSEVFEAMREGAAQIQAGARKPDVLRDL